MTSSRESHSGFCTTRATQPTCPIAGLIYPCRYVFLPPLDCSSYILASSIERHVTTHHKKDTYLTRLYQGHLRFCSSTNACDFSACYQQQQPLFGKKTVRHRPLCVWQVSRLTRCIPIMMMRIAATMPPIIILTRTTDTRRERQRMATWLPPGRNVQGYPPLKSFHHLSSAATF